MNLQNVITTGGSTTTVICIKKFRIACIIRFQKKRQLSENRNKTNQLLPFQHSFFDATFIFNKKGFSKSIRIWLHKNRCLMVAFSFRCLEENTTQSEQSQNTTVTSITFIQFLLLLKIYSKVVKRIFKRYKQLALSKTISEDCYNF